MTIPTHINNILGMAVRNISSTGSINFGNDIHKGYMAIDQASGGQEVYGDEHNSIINNFSFKS